jgi:beta-glucosidase
MTDRSPQALVDQLSLAEQVRLLAGESLWALPAIERLGIGRLVVTDGPNGARGGGGLTGGVKASAFPVSIALGASWDGELVEAVAAGIAQETLDKGAQVLLGPTVNLQRGPLNGRNFECFSEDPILSARLAEGYVRGLQGKGVAATVKHFVGNESEIQRRTMSSEIDERTLRELYLVPFEASVAAGAWAVMSSYNRLNGTHTSEHPWLLTKVLRQDWGFDGVVMSDWFGSQSTADALNAGLDIEMPGPTRHRGEKLLAAVAAGQVDAGTVRAAALRVLRLMQRTGALDNLAPRVERAIDRSETRALIRRAGAAGMVLLSNKGVLPLAPGQRLALIGPNARVARTMGGGSAQLNAHHAVSPWDGLAAALGEAQLSFARGCDNHRFRPPVAGPFVVEWFASPDLSGPVVHRSTLAESATFLMGELADGLIDPNSAYSLRVTGRFVPERTGPHDVGVHAAGRARVKIAGAEIVEAWDSWTLGTTFFEQGCEERLGTVMLEAGRAVEVVVEFRSARQHGLGLQGFHAGIGWPAGEAELAEAERVAAEADVAVLFIGRTADWDSEGADLPDMALPGTQDELVRRVAAVARRTVVVLQTGGPVEMEWAGDVDAIIEAWYPGQEAGHAIADVLTGRAEPGGRLPQSFPARFEDSPTAAAQPGTYPGENGKVRYAEKLHIGYRHHDRSGTSARFPFGHGLGYADIEIVGVRLEDARFEADGEVTVRVQLRNRADRAGSQVVQLYVMPENAPVERPPAELKGFGRITLGAGEAGEVTIPLGPRAFAYFDESRAAWVCAPGRYVLRAGLSAADAGHCIGVERTSALVVPLGDGSRP